MVVVVMTDNKQFGRFKLIGKNKLYHILDLSKTDGTHILTGEETVEILNSQEEKIKELEQFLYDTRQYTFQQLADQLVKDTIQLRNLLKEAEDEIERLKESNRGLLESIVEHESED